MWVCVLGGGEEGASDPPAILGTCLMPGLSAPAVSARMAGLFRRLGFHIGTHLSFWPLSSCCKVPVLSILLALVPGVPWVLSHLRITHRDLWTQPQGIHPHTPPSLFLCQTENRNSKSQGYRNIHSGQQETRTCPTRLCKTRHWAYLPVSSITFGVPITEEVLETHTFPPPRTKEAPSSASVEQERGPVMKLHGLSWLGLPLGA